MAVAACRPEESLRRSQRAATASGAVAVDQFPVAELGPDGIGSGSGFKRVSSGVVFRGGRVVVADPRVGAVYSYSPAGRLVSSLERLADGGPHFRAMWIGRCHGDSAFAWDPVVRRVAVISDSGRVVRQLSAPVDAADQACEPAGDVAVLSTSGHRRKASLSGNSPRDTATLRLIGMNGTPTRLSIRIPSTENRPLGLRTVIALSHSSVYVAYGPGDAVAVYDTAGAQVGSIDLQVPTRPVSRRHYRLALQDAVANFQTDADQDRAFKYLERIPPPATLPAYSAVFADPTGAVWVDISSLGDSATVLHGFSPEGHRLGEVRLPENVRVLDIDSNYLLGAYRLGSGREHVVVYRLKMLK